MDRLDVINALMKHKGLKNYLEIGVENGHVFFRIESTFKIAVDPKFTFDFTRRLGKSLINPYNLFNKYYEETSDDFFAKSAKGILSKKKLQLALIDGMHEFNYALRDVENTLDYLGEDGVIIMHDCNPQSAGAAGAFEEWKSGLWNGDVWKTIIYLRSMRKDLNVFVLDCDQGLGIITKKSQKTSLNYTIDEVEKLTYDDLSKDRAQLLNLKPTKYFYEYFNIPN